MMGWSPRSYIPSFVEIGLPVPEKILKGFYHICAWRLSWSCDQHHVIRFSLGSQGELIVYLCCLSQPWGYIHVYDHHFQSCSSLKPLGQSKPNFMWSLLGKEERKLTLNGPGHMNKMAVMPIYVKNLQKSFPTELRVL